ncbi:MAG: hypothetical protein HFG54_06725 [Lachnospiraceae bacterium]|jgi:tRNA(His) guanylyltransferase|nr:hypothetical protein [Lachnospiraceae bacterium]
MPTHDDLGCRMKSFYETVTKTRLVRRMPVVMRIDGKAFHTFTRGFEKPFDPVIIKSMQETMKYLCENIQGCVLGYTQSDEITLILVDYKKLTSSAWFDYEVQKICSVGASMATMAFNRIFLEHMEENEAFISAYKRVAHKAVFDNRCFNIPKEEVANLLYWRQLDAVRNSIQMAGQACFSYKELDNKTGKDIRNMLIEKKGINWEDYPTEQKWGSCCIRKERAEEPDSQIETEKGKIIRSSWEIDREIPVFKGEGRAYVERLVYVGEE